MNKLHRTVGGALAWRTRRPRLRTTEGKDERHASWLELFFDLVFVIGIAQLAIALEKDHSAAGFAWFAGLWLPVFVAWQGFSFYMDRFDTDDLYLRFSLFAGMVAVTSLSMQIPYVPKGEGTIRFALSYIVLRVITVALNYRAYRHVPEARILISRYNTGYLTSIGLWVISLFVPPPYRYILWGAGIIVDLLMPPVSGRQIHVAPISAAHVAERFGLFTLIVLGESLVAVGLGVAAEAWSLQTSLVAVLGFASVICLWWVYFDTNAGLELKEGNTAVVFAYAHLILLGALAAVGAGVHIVVKEVGQNHLSGGARAALCGGSALYLLSLIVAHWQTRRDIDPAVTNARLIVVGAQILIGVLAGNLPPVAFAALQLAPLIPLTFFETYHNTPVHVEGRKEEEKPKPAEESGGNEIDVGVGIGAESG